LYPLMTAQAKTITPMQMTISVSHGKRIAACGCSGPNAP
jgi:hypothetical protein